MPELGVNLRTNSAQFADGMNKMASTVQQSAGQMTKSLTTLQTTAKATQTAIEGLQRSSYLLAAIEIGSKIFAGLSDGIKEATEAERIVNVLDATLQATGKSALMSSESLGKMAGALSAMSGFDDEAILQMQSHLVSFGNIGPAVMERASKAAIDLAAKMGIELPQAAKLVGKALNEHSGDIGKLAAAGVTLTDSQMRMIKSFNDTGNTLGAQQVILQAIEGSVNGVAAAARNSVGGAWRMLTVEVGNFIQAVGQTPGLMEGVRNSLELAVVGVRGFTFILGDVHKRIAPFAAAIMSFVTGTLLQASQMFEQTAAKAMRFGSVMATVASQAANKFDLKKGMPASYTAEISKIWDDAWKGSANMEQMSAPLIHQMNPITQWQDMMKQLEAATKTAQTGVRAEIEQTGAKTDDATKKVSEHATVVKTKIAEAKTSWQQYREEIEKLAKSGNFDAQLRLAHIKNEEDAINKAKQALIGYSTSLQNMQGLSSLRKYTNQVGQKQELVNKAQGLTDNFDKLSDVKGINEAVQAEIRMFEQAQKLEKQLDQMYGSSGKFTGTLTQGLVSASATGNALEQTMLRVAQAIAQATQSASAMAYVAAAGGAKGGLKAGDVGAVQVGGGGYAFSASAAAAARSGSIESGAAKNVNNQDLPMGATFNVAPEGRARGGPVSAGQGYEVGEWGSETFVPQQDGMILNHADSRMMRPRQKKAKELRGAEVAAIASRYHQMKIAEMDRSYTGPDGEVSAYQYWTGQGRFASTYGRGASFGGPAIALTDDMLAELDASGGMANGGYADGSIVPMGERGPELAQLPPGTRVTPNHELPKNNGVNIQFQAHTVEPIAQVQKVVNSDGSALVKLIGRAAQREMGRGAKARAY